MRKFISNNKKVHKITFNGVNYNFILDEKGIGVRRQDGATPLSKDVDALTDYLFEEGWADRSQYSEIYED